ncbi:hypothetical protein V6N13_108970 [Hibiscus sabdariffa]
MKSREDAIRIVERLNGFRFYGYVIWIAMAYDNGQSSSWRKKRNSIVIEQRVTEPQQILVEGERQAMVQSNWSIEQDKEVGTVE